MLLWSAGQHRSHYPLPTPSVSRVYRKQRSYYWLHRSLQFLKAIFLIILAVAKAYFPIAALGFMFTVPVRFSTPHAFNSPFIARRMDLNNTQYINWRHTKRCGIM